MQATYNRPSIIPALMLISVLTCIAAAENARAERGQASQFYLVGAGPGDPDLITLRAISVLKQADLIFASESTKAKFASHLEGKEVIHGYWRLFPYYGEDPRDLEGEARRECEELAVKRNEFIAMVRRAVKEGKTVAVLDNGDPLIYGPWAWCLEEFEDLDPVVIPGLSCFNAANAALRRGITTSELTKAVILTSTDWPGKTDTIEKLSVHRSTMVLFTMKADLEEFVAKLSVHYPPKTPVAIVKHAGYVEKEAIIRGTLGTILDQVEDEALPFEYLIYVGDFLSHRYKQN